MASNSNKGAQQTTPQSRPDQTTVVSALERARLATPPWLLVIVLVVLTFVAYRPVWHAGFIWDDDDHLTENPAMTATHGLRMIWSSLAVSRYYPLTLTTFWFEHRLWGFESMPYHLVNIGFHAINGVLVFLLLRRWRIRAAWIAAMFWVLHPVNVESVAWITEMKNTQSGFFFFLTLLCFLQFDTGNDRRWYVTALICGMAAILSKPSTVVLPLVLLLCLWWEHGGWRRADIVRIAPFFAMATGMSVLTVIEQRGHVLKAGATTDWQLSVADRLVVAGNAVWFYASKVIWPVQLTFVYPRWRVDATYLTSWVPTATVLAVGVILWRRRSLPWCRAALFGWGFFVVALLPVLGFFNIFYFRYSFVADHFQYLASAGLVSLVAAAGAAICDQPGFREKPIGATAATMTLLVLGSLAWKQAHIYRDVQMVWQDTLAKNPACWMAHLHVGNHLLDVGQVPEAISHDELAVQIKPDSALAHYDLATALLQGGRVQEAIEHYGEALQIEPGDVKTHANLGIALQQAGRSEEAIGQYQEALRLKPDDAMVHTDLGSAFFRTGHLPDAVAEYREALRLKPDYDVAHDDLGIALQQMGRLSEAMGEFEQALRIKPDNAEAHANLGNALRQEGRVPEAIEQFEQALKLRPDLMVVKDALARLRAGQ
jgi:protein O-mannosyl-transferase